MTASRVLVAGGAGYIGSHVCKALHLAGYQAVTFDNLSTGWRDAVKFGPFEPGELNDRARLDAVFAQYRPVAVIHLAARSLVGEAMQDPGLYWRENVGSALSLIEATVAAGCRAFVFSSTCATYGDPDGVVIDESTPQNPINAYGGSKRAIEDMLADFGMARGLQTVIFRYFNVAGADPGGEVGEYHRPETHLVPLLLDAVAGRSPALTLHGSDYPTEDGTAIRDYVHVTDLAEAHVLGLRWLLDGKGGRVFCLGTGKGFSVREVIDAARAITNRDVPVVEGPRRAGDAIRLVCGSARAEIELGWRPERSTMLNIISDAWRWHLAGKYER